MPTMPSVRNIASVVKTFRDNLALRTPVTNFDRDSKSRAILDSITEEFINQDRQQVLIYNADRITSATGSDLDRVMLRVGLSRIQSTFATSLSSENSVAFYVESGTFGSINSGSSIVIPTGTKILSRPQNNELGQHIEYVVLTTATLEATSAIGFISVRAQIAGRGSNIGVGVLNSHNFTGYTDVTNNTLKVTNFYPILNGADQETDELFRSRGTFHYATLLQNNESKIRMQALTIPGVIDTKIIDGYFGIGTTGIIVLGAENQSTVALIQGVQQKIDVFKAPGAYIKAVAATSVSFDLEIDVVTSKALTTNNQERLTTSIRRVLLEGFRRVGLANTVTFSDLSDLIITQALNGISLRSKRHDLFKNIYVRKGYSNSQQDGTRKVIGPTFLLERDEYASLGSVTVNYVVRL